MKLYLSYFSKVLLNQIATLISKVENCTNNMNLKYLFKRNLLKFIIILILLLTTLFYLNKVIKAELHSTRTLSIWVLKRIYAENDINEVNSNLFDIQEKILFQRMMKDKKIDLKSMSGRYEISFSMEEETGMAI
ncbi:MAG: hypothetical protein RR443_02910 [Anaerorhabdus sp.]|uniref:hypothetical protein n=1 Tax=Anaerorhabdus sp. TaxID=1872524 RepID=UPI002FC925DA